MTARIVSGPPASTAARMMLALAKKPAVGGMPVSDSRKSVIRTPSNGSRRPRPANVARLEVTPGPLLERGDDRERAEVHERVGDAVEEQRLEALDPAVRVAGPGRQPDQHVAGVGDRAVGQHPLDVVLGQRDEVAEGHRQRRRGR